ncbi:hypothetical protein LINPERPRIM_LOCUS36718 [Linum perenne]
MLSVLGLPAGTCGALGMIESLVTFLFPLPVSPIKLQIGRERWPKLCRKMRAGSLEETNLWQQRSPGTRGQRTGPQSIRMDRSSVNQGRLRLVACSVIAQGVRLKPLQLTWVSALSPALSLEGLLLA